MSRICLRSTRKHLWTNFLTSLALLEVEPRADTLSLLVAEAVIKKLSNSLAVVKVRKRVTQRAS